MNVEHIGLCVNEPISQALWYKQNLGFKIIRSLGDDRDGVAFITPREGGTIIELGKLKDVPCIDFQLFHPVQFHIAIECNHPVEEAERLCTLGATFVGESPRNEIKNEKILIRDPWGLTLQLINRLKKLIPET